MRRPSFQFYPDDWSSNSNLKRCTHEEKGIWIDVMCVLHDQDEYGIARWPLAEIAQAVGTTKAKLKRLVEKGVLKGADAGEKCAPMVFVPRSGRKNGDPVTLIEEQEGPIWYSSRMVLDEYKRMVRGGTEAAPNGSPDASPKGGIGEGIDDTPKDSPDPSPSRAGASSPSSSSSSTTLNTHPLPFPAVREVIERCAQRARKDSAESFHNDLMVFLREEGWELTAEHQVEDRGDGRQGRVDILVTSPAVVGIELDRLSIREKSVFKLSQVEGYRVAVLREAAEHDGHADLDAVICCGTAKARERKPRIQLKTFLENCRAAGENAISGYKPLMTYVEETGLPMEFVQLAWDEFKRNFGPGGKDEARMQADWRRHFLNFVEKNYLRLWAARVGENGNEYFLTTQGLQAQALHRRREGVAA